MRHEDIYSTIFNNSILKYNGISTASLQGSTCDIKKAKLNRIKKVVFNNPATIVFWSDGTKTVVKCNDECWDPEKGLAMAVTKKFFGNEGFYYDIFKKWIPEERLAENYLVEIEKEMFGGKDDDRK